MKREEEKEVKSLLTLSEFKKLINMSKKEYKKIFQESFKNVQVHEIIDYYFDTQDEYFKNSKSVFRIRQQEEIIVANVKVKKEKYTQEYAIEITEKEFKNFLNTKKLSVKIINSFKKEKLDFSNFLFLNNALVKHKRITFLFHDFLIDLDHSFFGETEDFELEIESKKSKLDANKRLNQLRNNNIFKFKKSASKIKRYFDYQKGKKEGKIQIDSFNKEFKLSNFIVVVEGKNDEKRLKEVFPNINTFQTHGLGIQKETIDELEKIVIKNNLQIIVLTDPDMPGEYLRRLIQEHFNHVYHIHIEKEKAVDLKKQKVGIEHVTDKDIKAAFKNMHFQNKTTMKEKYKISDLVSLGIYNNKKRREKFCSFLSIAYGNNQKVLKQLNNYEIPKEKLKEFSERNI